MRTTIKKRIADNIGRIRDERGLTQKALAALMGPSVSPSWVSLIESGVRGVGPKRLPKLCKALGCDPSDLMVKDNAPMPVNDEEQYILELYRDAKVEGVHEEWAQYGLYKISASKKKKAKKKKQQEAWDRRKYPKKPQQHEAMQEGMSVRRQESQDSTDVDYHREAG